MKTDLSADDTLVGMSTPQLIAVSVGAVGGAAGAGAGARVQASSATLEFGRRLLLAARAGDTATVRALMAKGAPFTTDWLGTSPLHLAAANDHVDTVLVLLRAGVSRDARTKVERTPLHLAAYAGHARAAAALLAHGARVDPRDMLGMTPLHWAAQRGHVRVAAELLRRGADPTAESRFRKTPLALAAHDPALRRLMEDALREREAARSVSALVTEQMSEDMTTLPELETVQVQSSPARGADSGAGVAAGARAPGAPTRVDSKGESARPEGGEAAAAQLLRQHGITLLPADDGSTVLSALQSGRTVVLSDAGKLMLKESSTPPAPAPRGPKGVVLTATPVTSPPAPGVKIFTLNNTNKLLTVAKEGKPLPVRKVIDPKDLQVKYVQLSAEARAQSAADAPAPAPRPAVKIIMNKANLHKLVAAAHAPAAGQEGGGVVRVGLDGGAGAGANAEADSIVCVPEAFVRSSSVQYLRSQLLCAHAALAELRAELRTCRARLARYEGAQ